MVWETGLKFYERQCVRVSCLARNDSQLAICKANSPHSVYWHARVEFPTCGR